MRTLAIWLLLCGTAAAESPSPCTAHLDRVPLHQAARFLGHLYRTNVLVVSDAAALLTLEVNSAEGAGALRQLAESAGLGVGHKGSLVVLGPPDRVARAEAGRRGLPVGPPLALDLQRGPADELLAVVARALRLRLQGHVEGILSVAGEKIGALELAGVVTRLGGIEASRHEGALVVSGALPSVAAREVPTEDSSKRAPEELELAASGRCGERTLAGLRRRGDSTLFEVRIGDLLGPSATKVRSISPGSLLLEDGRHISPEGIP